MPQDLAVFWRNAEIQEAAGDFLAAQATYAEILGLDPTQAFAWLRLSMHAQRRGHYREARDLLLRSAEVVVRHRRWRVLPYLTMHLLTFDERELVRTVIEQADWTDRLVLEQSAVLTQQLWLADAHESALRHAELAALYAPDSHHLAYVRGMVLKYLGRMNEATGAFERSIELAPGFADAHWALAYHVNAVPAGARIDRIRKAQSNAKVDSLDQAYFGYALFKEYDAADDVELAWQALVNAAAIKRSLVGYDAGREHEAIETLCNMPQRDNTGRGLMMGSPAPIFIVGMPRTGTTLLERILGNHSQVFSAGELNAFTSSLSMWSDQFVTTPANREMLVRLETVDMVEVGNEYRRRTEKLAEGIPHFTDKNPSNIFNAGFIASAIPEARIICMRRNKMDAVFSNLKELFAGDAHAYSYDLCELDTHFTAFSKLVAHCKATLTDRFTVVDYEELVENPVRTAIEILNFCDLQYEPQCVDIVSNRSPVSTASSSQVREPIHRRGVGAWERYSKWLEPLHA